MLGLKRSEMPANPGVYFTRARLMLVFQERQEYARFWDGSTWSAPFMTTEDAREHWRNSGGVNRGKFIETRRLAYWRNV
ncbi:MAG: hypothetical protein ACRC1H_02670 [Caldilineaceae bacterium]